MQIDQLAIACCAVDAQSYYFLFCSLVSFAPGKFPFSALPSIHTYIRDSSFLFPRFICLLGKVPFLASLCIHSHIRDSSFLFPRFICRLRKDPLFGFALHP